MGRSHIHRRADSTGGGREVDSLTAHIDPLPTLAELCGVEHLDSKRGPIDGKSLVPILNGDAESWPDRTLFVHSQRVQDPKKWRRTAVMTDWWRLVNRDELYDMNADRGQETNVADQHPEVVKRLRKEYNRPGTP